MILIKSVLNSIPIYFLSFFRILKKVADKLVKVHRRFRGGGGGGGVMQSRRRLLGLVGDQLAYKRRKGVWELGTCPNLILPFLENGGGTCFTIKGAVG